MNSVVLLIIRFFLFRINRYNLHKKLDLLKAGIVFKYLFDIFEVLFDN